MANNKYEKKRKVISRWQITSISIEKEVLKKKYRTKKKLKKKKAKKKEIPNKRRMTTKAKKPWCQVCNTTKHDNSNCGKVLGYNVILFQYLSTIQYDPSSTIIASPGAKYDKHFLKYAIAYLRKNGYQDTLTNTRVFPDYEMKPKPNYNTLISYFYASLFQIRIKLRELRMEANQCPICMETISEKITITECGHKFCTTCINKHTGKQLSTKSSANCPCCRSIILTR